MSGADRFLAQDLRPRTVGGGDWDALSASHRQLLCLKGTVTRHLERLVGEPVDVDVVDQRVRPVGPLGTRCLQMHKGSPAIVRRVVAVTADGRQPLFCARTLLRPELLPADFLGRLRATRAGLGAALEVCDVRASRELLWWGRARLPRWAVDRGLAPDGLTRTYRFRLDHPFALVTEWFPLSMG